MWVVIVDTTTWKGVQREGEHAVLNATSTLTEEGLSAQLPSRTVGSIVACYITSLHRQHTQLVSTGTRITFSEIRNVLCGAATTRLRHGPVDELLQTLHVHQRPESPTQVQQRAYLWRLNGTTLAMHTVLCVNHKLVALRVLVHASRTESAFRRSVLLE